MKKKKNQQEPAWFISPWVSNKDQEPGFTPAASGSSFLCWQGILMGPESSKAGLYHYFPAHPAESQLFECTTPFTRATKWAESSTPLLQCLSYFKWGSREGEHSLKTYNQSSSTMITGPRHPWKTCITKNQSSLSGALKFPPDPLSMNPDCLQFLRPGPFLVISL